MTSSFLIITCITACALPLETLIAHGLLAKQAVKILYNYSIAS